MLDKTLYMSDNELINYMEGFYYGQKTYKDR